MHPTSFLKLILAGLLALAGLGLMLAPTLAQEPAGTDSPQPWRETVIGPAATTVRAAAAPAASGAVRHTYRLALAATGEYSQYHGGTVTTTLAALTATVDQLNAIFERELSVRFILVEQTPQLIYLDPAADPYTNGDTYLMALENQANLDQTVGAANYDLGHVLGYGPGSGTAWQGSLCSDSAKAKAATVTAAPLGDPFTLEVIAHELGHQLGAGHTYNARSDKACMFGWEAGAAYEPGSGSTLMSYAGLCPSQNLQAASDDYFHAASLAQMISFINGQGSRCGSHTASGNHPPQVEAGPVYTIPAHTPFTLTGAASDPDGDPLTYTWEQFDLGPAWLARSLPNTDADGQPRPIFRSYPPVDSPVRTFPRLENVLDGSHRNSGEALPAITRTLTFRLTARDNRGGLGLDTTHLAVAGSAGPFALITPTTALTWPAFSRQTVAWAEANTAKPPINCASVNLWLSTDGGQTFPTLLARDTANDGAESVFIPVNVTTSTARVKIACANNIFFDISDANFTLTATETHKIWLPLIQNMSE